MDSLFRAELIFFELVDLIRAFSPEVIFLFKNCNSGALPILRNCKYQVCESEKKVICFINQVLFIFLLTILSSRSSTYCLILKSLSYFLNQKF